MITLDMIMIVMISMTIIIIKVRTMLGLGIWGGQIGSLKWYTFDDQVRYDYDCYHHHDCYHDQDENNVLVWAFEGARKAAWMKWCSFDDKL